MKVFLLATTLLVGSYEVVKAQSSAPATGVPIAEQQISSKSNADSVQAVRALFHKRRTGGAIFTTLGGITAGRIIGASIGGESGGNAAGVATSALVVGGIPAGIGISKLARFSKQQEEAVLTAYQQGKPLPHKIRRRLKAKYFE